MAQTHTSSTSSTSAVRELKQCRQVSTAGGYVVAGLTDAPTVLANGAVVGERGRVALARRAVRRALMREYLGYLGVVLAQCAVIGALACVVLSALL